MNPYQNLCQVRQYKAIKFTIITLVFKQMSLQKQCQDGTEFHPDCLEAVVRNLYETYQCRMYSIKLLTMGREGARNM